MIKAGRFYAEGAAKGTAVVLSEPLSFYGGVDSETGKIIDHAHPELGRCITGSVLVMPGGRGSSSSSSVLAEIIRKGTGPVAIVLGAPDPIMVVASLVAESLYGLRCPIVVCNIAGISDGDEVDIDRAEDGGAEVHVQSVPANALS
jgi:predicted aconitase with swiveling domain